MALQALQALQSSGVAFRKILAHFPEDLSLAFAYGSGVFRQAGPSSNQKVRSPSHHHHHATPTNPLQEPQSCRFASCTDPPSGTTHQVCKVVEAAPRVQEAKDGDLGGLGELMLMGDAVVHRPVQCPDPG